MPSATRFIQAPVRSHMLSDEEMGRRQRELEQRRQFVLAATDYLGDRAIASRLHLWFTPPGRRDRKKQP